MTLLRIFWSLDQNHEVEGKIVAEICRVVSQREDIKKEEFDDSLRFRPKEIKKMDYFFNEFKIRVDSETSL